MKNFIISAVAFSMAMLAPVATTAQSFRQSSIDEQEFCTSLGTFAEGSMKARQYNIPEHDVLEILADSIIENEPPAALIALRLQVVIDAFEEPVEKTEPNKKAAVQQYKNVVKQACMDVMNSN